MAPVNTEKKDLHKTVELRLEYTKNLLSIISCYLRYKSKLGFQNLGRCPEFFAQFAKNTNSTVVKKTPPPPHTHTN